MLHDEIEIMQREIGMRIVRRVRPFEYDLITLVDISSDVCRLGFNPSDVLLGRTLAKLNCLKFRIIYEYPEFSGTLVQGWKRSSDDVRIALWALRDVSRYRPMPPYALLRAYRERVGQQRQPLTTELLCRS